MITFTRERGAIVALVQDGAAVALGRVCRTPSGPVILWDGAPSTRPPGDLAAAFLAWQQEER